MVVSGAKKSCLKSGSSSRAHSRTSSRCDADTTLEEDMATLCDSSNDDPWGDASPIKDACQSFSHRGP
eukprot:12382086-Karenia_brevis.AAC.1